MRSRHTIVVLIISVLVLLLSALPGRATFAKVYTLNVAPASVASGAEHTFTATYKGKSQFGVGSSNLTVPAEFTGVSLVSFVSSRGGTATLVGNTVELRGMNLGLNKTAVVTLKATVPCGPATYTWSAITKSSSSFGGGADFTLTSPSSLTTTATGECSPTELRFVEGRAPTDAATGDTITNTDFDPSGDPVQVEAVRNGARLTSFTGPIGLTASGGPGTLSGGAAVAAVDGVATFPSLSIDQPGTYVLTAASGSISVASDPITIADAGLGCGGSPFGSTLFESGDPGDVDLTREESGDCFDPIPVTVTFPAEDTVEIQKPFVADSAFTMTIDWTIENAVNPVPATQIDYGSGFHAMQFCLADGPDGGTFPDLPAGEFWCVTSQTVTLINSGPNAGSIQLTEDYFGGGDPRFRR